MPSTTLVSVGLSYEVPSHRGKEPVICWEQDGKLFVHPNMHEGFVHIVENRKFEELSKEDAQALLKAIFVTYNARVERNAVPLVSTGVYR